MTTHELEQEQGKNTLGAQHWIAQRRLIAMAAQQLPSTASGYVMPSLRAALHAVGTSSAEEATVEVAPGSQLMGASTWGHKAQRRKPA